MAKKKIKKTNKKNKKRKKIKKNTDDYYDSATAAWALGLIR